MTLVHESDQSAKTLVLYLLPYRFLADAVAGGVAICHTLVTD
ncbi:hypothetical protein [Thermocoleostomius sinensis]|uniref:Uncharacterized protein n=1 Tax=Thermocoleostomius sinensis A174 TaxID=2016057 RepID=A0A9E8ZET1_9CYAN|nr:hypothetical protein [Thermocoleostomius sinensis]WAL61843.1 hypothetical protein OXH18_07635 [Thermocoleostomius sinensis A174]